MSEHLNSQPGTDPTLIQGNQAVCHEAGIPTHEIKDARSIDYPIFSINNQDVTFRNRNEFPALDAPYIAIDDAGNRPALVNPAEAEATEFDRTRYYQGSETTPTAGSVFVVENTPASLVSAARKLGGESDSLAILQHELEQGQYSEKGLLLLDSIAAALSVDDEGRFSETMETNGFGLVLASLAGEEAATHKLGQKLTAYHEHRAQVRDQKVQIAAEYYARYAADVPVLQPEEAVIVHSTGHEIFTDEHGSPVLYPAGSLRADEYPRSSVHFTVNGEVESHMNGGDAWGKTNNLIVTNFARAVEANGLPANANPVDTYFSVNPGGRLTLPQATVVTGRAEGPLLSDEKGRLSYREAESFSPEETERIESMAKNAGIQNSELMSPAEKLRAIAVRTAMVRQGAKTIVKIGEHYNSDDTFSKAYNKMTNSLGVSETTLHENSADGRLVEDANLAMASGSMTGFIKDNRIGSQLYNYADASDAAIRMTIANGYVPARKMQYNPAYRNDDILV